jgi:(2Fe-2S) ferredoxin
MIGSITRKGPQFAPSITKEAINQLPLIEYSGTTHLIQSQEQLEEAIKDIRKEKYIGFDTETRPSFRKTDVYLPALVQLCTANAAYLIQLGRIQDYTPIASIFSNPSQMKAGVAIRDDLVGLMKIFPFVPEGFVELADLARLAEIQNTGLRSLCAITMGKRVSKSAQVSNWAKDDLTPKQITYAATDAWVSREIFMIFRKAGVLKKHASRNGKNPNMNAHLEKRIETLGIQKTKKHILFCGGCRNNRCSSAERGQESLRYLRKRIKELELDAQGVHVTVTECLDICQKGPILVVYPEGTWYNGCAPDVIERILQNHLVQKKPVKENLLFQNRLR